ncbi:uncharacterized protein VTP21DRAFT_4022 [Calcarisporiella thermophila]|uniref:uncharacterized protein n=1 Tax=Calcarisporiella thermophila TaxID=911321 RepID=UPI00374255E9
MEKYSRWRDPGTGIHPFLPPTPPRIDASIGQTILDYLLLVPCSLLAAIRILQLVCISLLWIILVEILGLILYPIRPLYLLWRRLFVFCLARTALLLMGFFYIPTETVSLRRGRATSESKTSWPPGGGVKPGDVIVANACSYVDLVYLAFRYDPIFTHTFVQTATLRPISLLTAILNLTHKPDLEPPQGSKDLDISKLAKEAKKLGRPLVIFPEGTTSNGRALLTFVPLFKECTLPVKEFNLYVMAFKYDSQGFSPSYTVGSLGAHVFKLCSQFTNSLGVKFLPPLESPSSPIFVRQTSNDGPSGADEKEEDVVGMQCQRLMGQISRLRRTKMGAREKIEFLNYYELRTKGYKEIGGRNWRMSTR